MRDGLSELMWQSHTAGVEALCLCSQYATLVCNAELACLVQPAM